MEENTESFDTHKSKLDSAISQLEDLYHNLTLDEKQLTEETSKQQPQPQIKTQLKSQEPPKWLIRRNESNQVCLCFVS